jgi:hypothetical protein
MNSACMSDARSDTELEPLKIQRRYQSVYFEKDIHIYFISSSETTKLLVIVSGQERVGSSGIHGKRFYCD